MKATTTVRPICEVAIDIRKFYPAMPYKVRDWYEKLHQLKTMDDVVGNETAEKIITNFLLEADRWRTENAFRVKEELRTIRRLG